MVLKQQLHALAKAYITARIQNAGQQIADAREAMGNETKSSAGDKYETAREMMQQDIDMATARVNDARMQMAVLDRVDVSTTPTTVLPGSIVHTDKGNFYIAVNAGQLKVDGISYQSVSLTSPIGQSMKGLSTGSLFTFNGKQYKIDKIE